MPGQLGPINLDVLLFNFFFTLSISTTGMPSVMQTINSIFASTASIIAAPANLGEHISWLRWQKFSLLLLVPY